MRDPQADQGNRCIVDHGIDDIEAPVGISDLQGERVGDHRDQIGREQSPGEPMKLDNELQRARREGRHQARLQGPGSFNNSEGG